MIMLIKIGLSFEQSFMNEPINSLIIYRIYCVLLDYVYREIERKRLTVGGPSSRVCRLLLQRAK